MWRIPIVNLCNNSGVVLETKETKKPERSSGLTFHLFSRLSHTRSCDHSATALLVWGFSIRSFLLDYTFLRGKPYVYFISLSQIPPLKNNESKTNKKTQTNKMVEWMNTILNHSTKPKYLICLYCTWNVTFYFTQNHVLVWEGKEEAELSLDYSLQLSRLLCSFWRSLWFF